MHRCILWVAVLLVAACVVVYLLGTNLNGHMMRGTPHMLYGEWLRWCAPPLRATAPAMHVFIHVCNIGKWDEVLHELMDHMQQSGLYDACVGLYYGCSCPNCETVVTERMRTAYPKAVALSTVPAPHHTHENWTVNAVLQFARDHPACSILYLHTKGVTNMSKSQQ